MSFHTGVMLYRPCRPPPMTADDLGRFIMEIRDAGVLTDDGFQVLQVRFGDSIDQDEKGITCEEDIAWGISTLSTIEWDLNLSCMGSVRQLVGALAGDKRRVYRAFVSLGTPTDAVLQPITRTNSPENDTDFCPDSLDIEVGPIEAYDLGGDVRAFVGWVAIFLSGYGYLYPWTLRDVVDRLQDAPEIQRIAQICRSFWPVPAERLEDRVVEGRKQLGGLWPYEDIYKQWDWYWGVRESG